jgi:hypothetical protein
MTDHYQLNLYLLGCDKKSGGLHHCIHKNKHLDFLGFILSYLSMKSAGLSTGGVAFSHQALASEAGWHPPQEFKKNRTTTSSLLASPQKALGSLTDHMETPSSVMDINQGELLNSFRKWSNHKPQLSTTKVKKTFTNDETTASLMWRINYIFLKSTVQSKAVKFKASSRYSAYPTKDPFFLMVDKVSTSLVLRTTRQQPSASLFSTIFHPALLCHHHIRILYLLFALLCWCI